jgi:hypothetical protein
MDDKKMVFSDISEECTVVRVRWGDPRAHWHYYMLLGGWWYEIGSDDGWEANDPDRRRNLDDEIHELEIVARPITG